MTWAAARIQFAARFVLTVAAITSLVVPTLVRRAPLPAQLVNAKSIVFVNDSGDIKAYDVFSTEITEWKRFGVVTKRDDADVIAVLTTNGAYAVAKGTATTSATDHTAPAFGSAFTIPDNYLGLKLFDARSGEVLWTDAVEKWVNVGHAPGRLVSHLKGRFPRQ